MAGPAAAIDLLIRARGANVVNREMKKVNRSLTGVRNNLRGLNVLFSTAIIARSTAAIARQADEYVKINNQVKLLEGQFQNLEGVQDQVFRIAQRTRASYEATGTLLTRIGRSAERYGATQAQILASTEAVQKTFRITGATTREAAAASIQFAQALGKGRLDGDELRSVLENNLRLSQLIAEEFGVSVDQLKKLGAEGKLISPRVLTAILKGATQIDKEFATLRKTFGDTKTVLDNVFVKFLGTVNKELGISDGTFDFGTRIAESLEDNTPEIIASITFIKGVITTLFLPAEILGAQLAVAFEKGKIAAGEFSIEADKIARAFETLSGLKIDFGSIDDFKFRGLADLLIPDDAKDAAKKVITDLLSDITGGEFNAETKSAGENVAVLAKLLKELFSETPDDLVSQIKEAKEEVDSLSGRLERLLDRRTRAATKRVDARGINTGLQDNLTKQIELTIKARAEARALVEELASRLPKAVQDQEDAAKAAGELGESLDAVVDAVKEGSPALTEQERALKALQERLSELNNKDLLAEYEATVARIRAEAAKLRAESKLIEEQTEAAKGEGLAEKPGFTLLDRDLEAIKTTEDAFKSLFTSIDQGAKSAVDNFVGNWLRGIEEILASDLAQRFTEFLFGDDLKAGDVLGGVVGGLLGNNQNNQGPDLSTLGGIAPGIQGQKSPSDDLKKQLEFLAPSLDSLSAMVEENTQATAQGNIITRLLSTVSQALGLTQQATTAVDVSATTANTAALIANTAALAASAATSAASGAGGLLGFRDGGQFTVGGRSGIDQNVVAFRASRGETVSINKNGSGGGVVISMPITVNGNLDNVTMDDLKRAQRATVDAALTKVVQGQRNGTIGGRTS